MTILSKLTFLFGLVAMPALASAETDAKPDKPDRAAMHQKRAEARFDAMDADHDGVLSKQEFLAAKMHQGRHGKKHGKHQARRGNGQNRGKKDQAPSP